jgi:predicted nucleotidyltransferase
VGLPDNIQRILDILKKIASENENIKALFITGSVAEGRADHLSDIDVGYVIDDPENFYIEKEIYPELGRVIFSRSFIFYGVAARTIVLDDGTLLDMFFYIFNKSVIRCSNPLVLYDPLKIVPEGAPEESEEAEGPSIEKAKIESVLRDFWYFCHFYYRPLMRGDLFYSLYGLHIVRTELVKLIRICKESSGMNYLYKKLGDDLNERESNILKETFVKPEMSSVAEAFKLCIKEGEMLTGKITEKYGVECSAEFIDLVKKEYGLL